MSDNDTKSIPAAEARKNLSELVSSAFYSKVRVRISKHGKDFAAIVPIEDLELLQALEDRIDVEISRERLESDERLSLSELRESLAAKS